MTRIRGPVRGITSKTPVGRFVEFYDVIEGFAVAMHIVESRGDAVVAELRFCPISQRPKMDDDEARDKFTNRRGEMVGEWDIEAVDVPRRGLRSSDIRQRLALETLFGKALQRLDVMIEPGPGDKPRFFGYFDQADEKRADDSLAAAVPKTLKSRARERDDLYYAQVAREYAKVVRTKKRGVYEELHNRLDKSRKYLPDLIKEARRRRLLTKAPDRGKAGGRLTKKAERILERAEEAS